MTTFGTIRADRGKTPHRIKALEILTKGIVYVKAGTDLVEGEMVAVDEDGHAYPAARTTYGLRPIGPTGTALARTTAIIDMNTRTCIRVEFAGPTPRKHYTRRQRRRRRSKGK